MKLLRSFALISQRFLRTLALLPLLIVGGLVQAEIADEKVEFSSAELDQILAPIALYPDTVLSQVLIAATYPIEVVQADRWARANPSVKGADAVEMVENKDWDPSVKALVAFPDILQRMSDDVDWTQKLGDAFLSNEARVMDTIQSLRKKAYASGSLDKVQHLKVQRDVDQIIIEPAQERVVYVPVYDTRVVYGNWWWPDYPPVYWHYPSSYTYVSGFYWGSSIHIGTNYFYSSCHWRNRHVVVIDRHSHYSNTRFYTGRSIIGHESAREWHHAPAHRRGVAYYNNDLRERYGSRNESYRDARSYREEHRREDHRGQLRAGHVDSARGTSTQQGRGDNRTAPSRSNGINIGSPANTAENSRPTIDRSAQLRERMNRSNTEMNGTTNPLADRDRAIRGNSDSVKPMDRSRAGNNENQGQHIDRSFQRNNNIVKGSNATDSAQGQDRSRFERDATATPTNEPVARQSTTRPLEAEQPNSRGFSRPTINDDNRRSAPERIQQESAPAPERSTTDNSRYNRPSRVDDSTSRRFEAPRTEQPRQERRSDPRPERESSRTREHSDNGDRGQNRFQRAM